MCFVRMFVDGSLPSISNLDEAEGMSGIEGRKTLETAIYNNFGSTELLNSDYVLIYFFYTKKLFLCVFRKNSRFEVHCRKSLSVRSSSAYLVIPWASFSVYLTTFDDAWDSARDEDYRLHLFVLMLHVLLRNLLPRILAITLKGGKDVTRENSEVEFFSGYGNLMKSKKSHCLFLLLSGSTASFSSSLAPLPLSLPL